MPMATKEAQREYQRVWKNARRAEWFKDKMCAKCGSKENLQLDHVDPSTKVHNQVWTWAKHRRDEELAKCQALCVDCHKKKTVTDLRAMDHCAHLRKVDPPGMAWCYGHQDYISVDDFTKDRAKRRGLETDCRECRRKRRNKKKYGGDASTVDQQTVNLPH